MFTTASGRPISYYGREYTAGLQRKNGSRGIIDSVDQLFSILLEVWCRETAYPRCQSDYDHENDPTYGQCAITAALVSDMFGGTIHKIRVADGGTHYFNKIQDHYIDLTRDQFDLYDIAVTYEHNEVVPREFCGVNADTRKRYQRLVQLVAEWLSMHENFPPAVAAGEKIC